MNKYVIVLFIAGLIISACARTETDYPISPVDFTSVKVTQGFWKKEIDTVTSVTIPFAFKKCEETGRVNNFIYAAGIKEGKFQGRFGFDDSDVYKIIEGASYALMTREDPGLKAYLDTLIYYIAQAQEDDGYLYTPWTLKVNDYDTIYCSYDNEGRFIGCRHSHELYNAGHMYEAAAAHYMATGERSFLDVALKNADFIYDLCVNQGKDFYPGHQEVEIGLVKLYRITKDEKYLELAKLFLDRRGHGKREYDDESGVLWKSSKYAQDHKPVTEQREAVGHAVRATYMYAAMADIAALTGNKDYLNAIDSIWKNVVTKKLYITGGIGAGRGAEAFGDNYELPNNSYAETCAAIANVYWNHRMFLLHGDAKYIDVLERTLYNGLISGISLDGKLFFYPNTLKHDGKSRFNQGAGTRMPWFDCSCCPSNLCRFMPSVAGYAYAVKDNNIYVNLFINSEAEVTTNNGIVQIAQTSNYPWEGNIMFEIKNEIPVKASLLIRVPGWVKNEPVPGDLYSYVNAGKTEPVFYVNGKIKKVGIAANGYAIITKKWQKGDKVEAVLPMQVKRAIANEKVKEDRGLQAFEYGPVVYCAEAYDNNGKALNIVIKSEAQFNAEYVPGVLNGINILKGEGRQDEGRIVEDIKVKLIPYYAWNNRGEGEMTLWLKTE
jgi:DUF1680 family protein